MLNLLLLRFGIVAIVFWLNQQTANACLAGGFGCSLYDYGSSCGMPIYNGGIGGNRRYFNSPYGYPDAYSPVASMGPYCCDFSEIFGRRRRRKRQLALWRMSEQHAARYLH